MRLTRWSLAAALVLIGTLWLASAWTYVGWRSHVGDSIAFILKGRFEWFAGPPSRSGTPLGPPPPGFSAGRASRLWMWDQTWQWRPLLQTWELAFHIILPLWIPFALVALPGIPLWTVQVRRAHRRRAGKCPVCAYDLKGISPDAACPECGAGRDASLHVKEVAT